MSMSKWYDFSIDFLLLPRYAKLARVISSVLANVRKGVSIGTAPITAWTLAAGMGFNSAVRFDLPVGSLGRQLQQLLLCILCLLNVL